MGKIVWIKFCNIYEKFFNIFVIKVFFCYKDIEIVKFLDFLK